MTAPKLDYTISIGSILTILTIAVGGGIAWGVMDGRVAAIHEANLAQDQRLDGGDDLARELELRTRALELGSGRVDERLIGMSASLSRIEQRLEQAIP